MVSVIFFLSSGLFLGWTLGANDAANIWGTAVGTRMVSFKKAALLCGIFVTLGAVLSGYGASEGLGALGRINALPGAFTVALAAGLSVFWMTRLALPVSVTHAIVGAIIGWSLFSNNPVDYSALQKILWTWLYSPLLTAIFSALFFFLIRTFLRKRHFHLLRVDAWTRGAMLTIGAFGSFSLGANNIGNVIGVFLPSNPFQNLDIFNLFTISGTHILLFLGGLAISVGVFMYSKKVMMTVGVKIFPLSPLDALVVIFSSALVLFLFASQELNAFLTSVGLPAFPLIPVSSSQSVVGGVLGIAIAKGAWRNISVKTIGRILMSWIASPTIAGLTAYIMLFIVQNVFGQNVI